MTTIAVTYIITYILLMQVFLVGKANFHPIRGKGVEWLEQELAACNDAALIGKAVSPLRLSWVYNMSRFPSLVSYIVHTEDRLSYSVWRFTKASYILGRYYRTHKKTKPTYLKF